MPPGDYLTFPHLAPNKFSKIKKKKKRKERRTHMGAEHTVPDQAAELEQENGWREDRGGGKQKKTDGNERLTAQQGHFWRDPAALHLTLRSLFMLHLNIGLRHFIKGLTLFLCFTLGGDRLKETG